MVNQKKVTALINKLELNHHCLEQIYVILVIRILLQGIVVVKGNITLEGDNDANKRNKNLTLKIMHHLLAASQKLMV